MSVALINHLKELNLLKYQPFLLSLVKPSIELIPSKTVITIGCSKFGGSPDVPKDFRWPEHERAVYRFIAQINLTQLPKIKTDLPKQGLLSFFYADDEEGEVEAYEPGFVLAYHFKDTKTLKSKTPPKAVQLGSTYSIHLHASVDVPEWPFDDSLLEKWPIEEPNHDNYIELRERLHPSGRYLLGYPTNTTLCSDPTPSVEWTSLLTLNTDDDMCWGDGDWLVTFIESQRLREGDFSKIQAETG